MTDNPFSTAPTTGIPSISNAVSELRHATGDFAAATGAEASKLKECAIETAHSFKAAATETTDQYKAVASEKILQAKETAQYQWEETRVKAKELHVTAEDYIRQNPTKAVLGALGIGFLLGLIARK